MSRVVALLTALLATLAITAPALAAGTPPLKPTSPPLRAYASVSPQVQLFGTPVTARLAVIVDTKQANPNRLRVTAKFAPYTPGRPHMTRSGRGRFVQETWTWKVWCISGDCVPTSKGSDFARPFRFRLATVDYLDARGKVAYTLNPRFPQVLEISQVSPAEHSYVIAYKHINWAYQLAPATAQPYRVSPALVFWLAIAVSGLLAATGFALAGRWFLRLRSPAVVAAPGPPPSYLERALAVFFWASERGDETLQRKALERVADELPLDVIHLSDTARELAWSPESPQEDEVESISERAGVPAHHVDGAEA